MAGGTSSPRGGTQLTYYEHKETKWRQYPGHGQVTPTSDDWYCHQCHWPRGHGPACWWCVQNPHGLWKIVVNLGGDGPDGDANILGAAGHEAVMGADGHDGDANTSVAADGHDVDGHDVNMGADGHDGLPA